MSEHPSSVPDLGPRAESFLNFGDGSTFESGHFPPLESETSTGEHLNQFNLAHGNLGHSEKHFTIFGSVKRRLHVWKQRLLRPFPPYSMISQVRYALVLMATIIYVLWFPVELAFPDHHPHGNIRIIVVIMLTLDVLITLRTSFVTETGAIVVSSWQIVLHYVKTRLVLDFLMLASLLAQIYTDAFGDKWLFFMLGGLTLERFAYIMRFVRMIWLVRANQSGSGNNFWAWMLYSRYSHLFRIAGIVAMVIFVAHYIACIWTLLIDEAEDFEPSVMSWRDKYASSFYAALLLMQGEGVQAETVAQNLFASLSVVLGSIVLAVVFGHVAILVSNFNANTTSYQRKMEEVFAMTAKLQLPAPLRERIHEYYEHLWHEYECLDGEIVQFSKGLSHSLGLEVVLFKYMEVVMHVSFWKDCTPDFQKQLMLQLDVRVYLPNDFIMRQGEVDVEFYMVNRGYCELDRDANRFERITTTALAGRTDFKTGRSNSVTGRRHTISMNGSQLSDASVQSAYELDAVQRKFYNNGGRDGKGQEVLISRGQAFGDMALLMNYQRAANVRAITHVEMCVLSRDKFQTVLSKYPEDRHRVVVDMLASYMQSYEASKSRCPLLELVRRVYSPEAIAEVCAKVGAPPPFIPPTLTAHQAAERIYTAINKESNDSTLKFGVGVNIHEKLVALRERRRKKRESCRPNATSASTPNGNDNSTNHVEGGVSSTVTTEAPKHQEPPQSPSSLPLQERLRLLEEREMVILQGLKELQGSFEILRARSTATPLPTRKRLAPGDDTPIAKSTRTPLLRRVGSFVGVTMANNLKQVQSAKQSPTRYADKLFNQQTPSLTGARRQRQDDQIPVVQHPNSFRITSEVEPTNSIFESSLEPKTVAVSTTDINRISAKQPPESQSLREGLSGEHNPRLMFKRMASRSLRKLEGAVQSQSRTESGIMKSTPAERSKTFQRTHSQSFRTMADTLSTPLRPRTSFTPPAQTRVLKRMSSFVSDTSGQQNSKRSPTRYADELFRRRSNESPTEEGWESK
ncbi:Voltage-gated Ion Channel [Phytophthora megakarya]|uniref:Voltage-gated Ion Channel n=1 Tax=Phytophthora megakarya TaxID=4795 RepID=A0A225WJA0_9STRA|nr:Voltage-gated Ion Channel [Phytophthora megakarya]